MNFGSAKLFTKTTKYLKILKTYLPFDIHSIINFLTLNITITYICQDIYTQHHILNMYKEIKSIYLTKRIGRQGIKEKDGMKKCQLFFELFSPM